MISKRYLALRRNLSAKLLTLFIVGGLVLSALIGGLTQFGFESRFVSQIRPHFKHYIREIHQQIGSPPDIEIAKKIAQDRPIIIRIFSRDQTWASDGDTTRPERIRRHDKKRFDLNWDRPRPPRKLAHPRADRGIFSDKGNLFILKSGPGYQTFYGFKVRPGSIAWFPILAGLIVLLGLAAFYRSTRRLFAPLKSIQQGVRLIGDGKLGHQIEVVRNDELGELATRVNQMSLDLAQMMQAKRELLLALSHELKSPLARARVTLELLEKSDYQQALISDQKQIERLIDEVLESERLYTDHAPLHRTPTDILDLAESVLKEDISPTSPIQTEYEKGVVQVAVDANQIRRLIRNLLENALQYHRAERGAITLGIDVDEQVLRIKVSDQGAGIEAKHLPRLTEAFYRVDPARAKKTGGLGLGLYMCNIIAQAHGGKIEISSELGQGTTVTAHISLLDEVLAEYS